VTPIIGCDHLANSTLVVKVGITGGGWFAVDPELVGANEEGEDVAGGGDEAVAGQVVVAVLHVLDERADVHMGDVEGQVVDQGHAAHVEQDGHQTELEDAPYAEQEAASAELGPTESRSSCRHPRRVAWLI